VRGCEEVAEGWRGGEREKGGVKIKVECKKRSGK